MPRFCTGLLEDGRRCDYRALPGHPFCSGHSPDNAHLYRRCQYFNQLGAPCGSWPLRGRDYCFTHSPRNRRAKDSPIPLVPRTCRQKQRAKWLVFRPLPQSPTTPLQPTRNQQFATVPLERGRGLPITA